MTIFGLKWSDKRFHLDFLKDEQQHKYMECISAKKKKKTHFFVEVSLENSLMLLFRNAPNLIMMLHDITTAHHPIKNTAILQFNTGRASPTAKLPKLNWLGNR